MVVGNEGMGTLRDRIERRLRAEVCPLCRKGRSDGGCEQSADFPCPLMGRLDEVTEVISGIRDYSLEPYQERLREVVCSSCPSGKSGTCARRDEGDCALDAHFPKIVAVIESELAADPGLV